MLISVILIKKYVTAWYISMKSWYDGDFIGDLFLTPGTTWPFTCCILNCACDTRFEFCSVIFVWEVCKMYWDLEENCIYEVDVVVDIY